jgi:hypothetical protein
MAIMFKKLVENFENSVYQYQNSTWAPLRGVLNGVMVRSTVL